MTINASAIAKLAMDEQHSDPYNTMADLLPIWDKLTL